MRFNGFIGVLATGAAIVMLAGCTTANSAPSQSGGGAVSLTKPASAPTPGERPKMTTKKPGKDFKIAIIAIENNPFFAQVKEGYVAAKKKLKTVGVTVDWINAGTDVNVDNVGNAMNAAVVSGYDAIAALMPGDGICSYVKQAVSQGIIVAAYNGGVSCAEKAGATFFHGTDFVAAGSQAGQLMCHATADLASKDSPGKVGIETETFSYQALEILRKEFLKTLKSDCPWVTPAGDAVEYQGSTDRMASAARDFMTSTPDLVGMYVVGGNPWVVAKTVADAGKTDQIKTIGFDFTAENVTQIENGAMYAAIGQDPYGQAYDTLIWIYNALVTGEAPSPDYFIPTKTQVGTQDTIKQFINSN